MNKSLRAAALLATLSIASAAAAHATAYDVSITGDAAIGPVAAVITINSRDQVTAISGTVNGAVITALDSTFDGPDNNFNPIAPYVDGDGISFDTATNAFNVYYVGQSHVLTDSQGLASVSFNVTPATASPLPEPATLTMLASGMAGLFGLRRRAG